MVGVGVHQGAAKKTDPNILLCQPGWSDAPGIVTECEHNPMFATLRYRLACKSALYVAPDECYRQGERQARTLLCRTFFHHNRRRLNRAFNASSMIWRRRSWQFEPTFPG